MSRLLIVDDNSQNLYLLQTLLEGHGYEVVSAVNGTEALEKARQDPPDIIVSDILMPVMDGFTLCHQWKTDDYLKNIPFVFYSAEYIDEKDECLALKEGADRFIRKPVEPDEFMRAIHDIEENANNGRLAAREPAPETEEEIFKLYSERLINKLEQKMTDLERLNTELLLAYDTTIEGWSKALDMRDKETEGHSQRVARETLHIAREMGIGDSELVHVKRGALFHDMGKIGIPDSILYKPGPLTEEEKKIMNRHPVYAYDMLSSIPFLLPALDIPYCHHEKWDGTGYPRGLKDNKIPLAARIFAVVDVWDALISDRFYRTAWPKEKALEHIRFSSVTHFDPNVVELFLKIVPEMDN